MLLPPRPVCPVCSVLGFEPRVSQVLGKHPSSKLHSYIDFVFVPPTRSVYITFSGFESVEGLPAFRYKVPAEILANTSENAGFCIPEGNCMDSGVLNVSVCKNGKKF